MIIRADASHIPLREACVQCCVTSPPYWGLRDYGSPGQLGLEPTPTAYVANLVHVFAEVRRVLADDGTVWLNLGDSYHNVRTHNNGGVPTNTVHVGGSRDGTEGFNRENRNKPLQGLKEKDLVGIPWRVAFALQADGWYLRSDIIWSKPNPMPESVTDRPTKSHEYLFLLTKSERYFYDAQAISEPVSDALLQQIEHGYSGQGTKAYEIAGVQNPSDVKSRIIGNARKRADRFGGTKHDGDTSKHSDGSVYTGRPTRNKRSVWTIPTMPYVGAHFATMPEALIEPCILAGSAIGNLVYDPFLGSGTVGAVAERLSRRWVGTDLAYQDLSKERTAQRGLMFL